MSTSLLYHGFGTITYTYVKTLFEKGTIYFFLRKKSCKQRCAVCHSRKVSPQGEEKSYAIKTLPIGSKPVVLVITLQRLKCQECGAKRQESRDLAQPRKSYSRQLAKLVCDLAHRMNLQDLADHLGLAWHTVKDILKNHLEKKEKRRSWREVRWIGIDEIAVRKGHRYLTVVVDLESGQVLEVVEGRDAACLKPIFTRLKRAKAALQAVAIDMSPSFRKAIAEYAGDGVAIVHDPFHLIQAMNRVIDQVRRDEQARLDQEGKKWIKGNRFLLLKGRENLADKERGRLEEMLAINHQLNQVYLLKEDLRQLWCQPNKQEAGAFLQTWLEQAFSLGLKPLTTLAKTITKYREAILAWYDFPVTTGPLEGLNNKIKTLKRRAYGFRDLAFFRLLILFIHWGPFKLSDPRERMRKKRKHIFYPQGKSKSGLAPALR